MSAARISLIDLRPRRRRESGGGLVIVMIVVCVLSGVAACLLLTNVARYFTTFQSVSWQESIVASEAGVDLAMNELRKRVVDSPSVSFRTGWTAANPANGTAYGSFGHAFPATTGPYSLPAHGGEGNTSTQMRVFVDVPGSNAAPNNFAAANDTSFISQLDNPNLRDSDGVDRSRWWFRIRALGIAGVTGPPRPNLDKRDNRLRQVSFFNDWRTGQNLSSPQVARMVEAVARPLTNFRNALMANVQINLSNKDVLIDSYDSSQGPYSSTTNHGMMGNIATNGQLINANNAVVDGDALTDNGAVTNGGNVTGQKSSNFFQELTPLTPASLNPSWITVPDGGTLTANATYTASTDSTNPTLVRLDGINLPATGQTINLAAPAGTATAATPAYIKVYVQGDITTAGTSSINVAASVNAIIFFTGNVNLQGSGIINNSFLARQLVLNGIQPPANGDGSFPSRSITVATTQDFEGIVYAPNHDLTLALQAAPASGTTGTNSGLSNNVTNQINGLQGQINNLNNDITIQQNAYNNAAAGNQQGNQNESRPMQEAQTKIANDRAQIATLQQQIAALTGGPNPTSSATDHALGYNGIYGAFVGHTITVAEKTHLHYDQNLRTAGPVNHYEVVNWFEDNASRDSAGGGELFWWR